VEFVTPLSPSDRTDPALDGMSKPLDVTAIFVDTPEGAAAEKAAASRAVGRPAVAAPHLRGMRTATMTLTPEGLDEISRWKEVVWLEPRRPPVLHDEVSALITAGIVAAGRPLGPHYREWLTFHGLDDLSSYIVQVQDTGIDTGGLGASHPALAGRLAFSLDETVEGSLDDCVGHGTHVAGIIAGDPPPEADLRDADGYTLGLGVAPTARVGSSRIFTCAGFASTVRSYTAILTEAYGLGARVSNNSWGDGAGTYSALAREFDGLVRDVNADPADGEQPMIVVASAGNEGQSGVGTVDPPGAAKNVIAVGATESFRPEATDGCDIGPEGADDVDHVRVTSSRGPTNDGRLKPDVVAPGSHIISLVSQAPGYTGLGVCDRYYPPSQRLYTWTGGTSQAAAHVSGAAVLMLADHERTFGSVPSPAMVKAALIASARDLGRSRPGAPLLVEHRPDPAQGWGRVDLSALIGRRDRAAFDQQDILTGSGEERVKGPFRVADPNRPLAVVLAWTDAPGTPAGTAWVNDLDLEVTAGGTTYLGNVLADGFSVSGGSGDPRNNVETVFLAPPVPEVLTVRVVAVSLPGDGVPSSPGLTDQDFALYLDNVIEVGPAGKVILDRDAYACGGEAGILVSDRHLAGGGSVRVESASESEPLAESLDLEEDPAGSGLFRGSIRIESTPTARDGILQVTDGETITVTYHDRDTGDGAPATITASAAARCAPLGISDVRAENLGRDSAVVAWRTSRPADSTVTGSPGISFHDPVIVVEHRAVLKALRFCTSHAYQVSSTDASGATASSPASGTLTFSTGSGQGMPVFSDDFESNLSHWTHEGAGDEWELGIPRAGPGRAYSGAHAWGTDLDGTYEVSADMSLASPPIDLRGRTGAVLSFRHFFDIPVLSAPGGPQDGAWVEASLDGGATWDVIAPVQGYTLSEGPNNPYLPPGSGVFAGTLPGWTVVTFDLTPFQVRIVRVRFRLWRDPHSTVPPRSGWYIDDVMVTVSLPCRQGILILDAPDYGCSGVVRATLADSDLDLNPVDRDVASAIGTGVSGSVGILLVETGDDTGVFTGSLPLGSVNAPGRLAVSSGDTISVKYADADDGSGSPVTVQVSASVADCSAPSPPTGVRAAPGGSGRLRVDWIDPPESDLAEVRLHYDTDAPGPIYTGQGALEGSSPVRAETGRGEAVLSGLPPCRPHFVTLSAMDTFGNESVFSTEAVGVPGAGPCPRATLTLTPADGAGCSQSVALVLDDANADLDPGSPGTVTVAATSPSATGPLSVLLQETGASTGRFAGTLPLSAAAAPGRLRVSEGDTVEVTYDDAEAGSGAATIRERLRIDDCTPPVISGARLAFLGLDKVRLEWTTDERASARVEYGLDPSLDLSASDPSQAPRHTVTLGPLPPCAAVYYRIFSADTRGNAAMLDDDGAPFRLGTARELLSFFDDFESGAAGWTHGGLQDEWELGAPAAGPPGPYSPATVWGTDLDDTYERNADMSLVSPEIDLTGIDSARLTFRHWYDIYTSEPGRGLDDGAWVEVSRDGGRSWTYVVPEGGYPDIVANNSYIPLGSGVYAGTTATWEPAVLNLDAFAGGPIRIRFHLDQDEADNSNVPGLGWYIDDVEVRSAVACRQGRVRLGAAERDCGAPLTVRLRDADLDDDPAAQDTAAVRLTSPSDPTPFDAVLLESGLSTGAFIAAIPIGPTGGPGTLRVFEGDVVTAAYDDADDGTGATGRSEDTTRVRDCTPPVIRDVRVRSLSADSALVEWETDEPSTSEVRLVPSGPSFGGTALVTGHAVLLTGLLPCTPYSLEAASADAGGNRSVADNGGVFIPLDAAREIDVLSEGFEAGAPGWTHGGVHDEWEFGAPLTGPPAAIEGAAMAGTDLDGDYDKDTLRQRGESFLISPPFSLENASAATLAFRHYFDFVPTTEGDGALVEAWDGMHWNTLAPQGGYPGFLRVDRSEAKVRAFTGSSPGWIESRFDLAAYVGRTLRLRFRVVLDHGTPGTAAGWYLDRIRVTAVAPCRRGVVLLDRDAYACGPAAARVLLSDADLDKDPSERETISLPAAAGGNTSSIDLTETGAATGVFEGQVSLAPSPGSGDLVVSEGDVLEVTYADDDDGTGAPFIARDAAAIGDCRAPVIAGVSVSRIDDGTTVRVRFRTDEPSTTEGSLAAGTAAAEVVSTADMVTDHLLTFPGLPDCERFTLAVSATDEAGNTARAAGAEPPFAAETIRRRILFRDDMEGPNPGWFAVGRLSEWERGVPLVGPPAAFSGALVTGTDLDGQYEINTDSVLLSPPINLRGVASATLTFWHFYHIFAQGSPNADDDGAWVEVEHSGLPLPEYIRPVETYPDTIDRDAPPPIPGGSGVYAGFTSAWRRAVFDLSRYAGEVITLRFRLWNDSLSLQTGSGWYIDDVEVTSPETCEPSPSLTAASAGRLVQGASGVPLAVSGTNLREPLLLVGGAGVVIHSVSASTPDSATALVDVAATAAEGPHDLRAVNPDGQSATLTGALIVEIDPDRSDIDGSGGVDGRDLAVLAGAFGAFSGEARYRMDADLNGDGAVDGRDLAILGANFGRALGP